MANIAFHGSAMWKYVGHKADSLWNLNRCCSLRLFSALISCLMSGHTDANSSLMPMKGEEDAW